MTDEAKLEEKLWKHLKSDRTVMLGLAGDESHAQPMTVQFDGEAGRGPLYMFTSKETDLARALGASGEASIQFASKGHDVFAALDGMLSVHNDRATIDRLWSPFVAAWFESKDDPKLLLLRFDAEHAQIWLNENSVFAGIKLLLGSDPKQDFKDKTAEVRLS